MSDLLDCPMRWQKRNLEGMRLPSTPPALIGTAVHASTAVYDQGQVDSPGSVSIDDAAGVAVDAINNPEDDVDWMGMRAEKAINTAIRTHVAYCEEIAHQHDYTIVEHTLKPLKIDMGDGVVFELTGTLDRIRQDEFGYRGVSDVKTGMAAVGADGRVVIGKHAAQLGTYTVLAEQEFGPMMLPAGIIGLSTGGSARVGFSEVKDAKSSLIGEFDEPGLLHFIKPYFKTGMFPPNPGSFMCSKKYCPFFSRCRFHG
jgi:hypothetical protein